MKMTDVIPGQRLVGLGKGEHGSGKTIGLCSFALYGPLYLALSEHRFASVATYYGRYLPRVRPDLKEDCEKIMSNITFDIFDSFDSLDRRLSDLVGYCPYYFVIADSLTSMAENTVQEILGSKKAGKGKRVGGIKVTDVEDYSGEFSGIMQLFHQSLRIEAHVWWTAHVIQLSEKSGNVTTVSRLLVTRGKKVAAALPGNFDEGWHFTVVPSMDPAVPPRYTVITRAGGDDWAKTSLDLPPVIDFTNDILAKKIHEYYPSVSEKVTKAMLPSEASENSGW